MRTNAYAYANKTKSLRYIMDKLAEIDDGAYVDLDFISTEDVGKFCALFGFRTNWAGKSIDEICGKKSKPDFGPQVVHREEAEIILDIVRKMVREGQFKSREGSSFDKTLLNDFLPRSRSFEGKPTLGHMWEFQYALQVELEHGRTRGTNVTNNHPLLTALVVLAHLTEDTLYYARLWPMEVEGEMTKAIMEKKPKDDVYDMAKEWVRAKAYLAKRLAEKAQGEIDLPE